MRGSYSSGHAGRVDLRLEDWTRARGSNGARAGTLATSDISRVSWPFSPQIRGSRRKHWRSPSRRSSRGSHSAIEAQKAGLKSQCRRTDHGGTTANILMEVFGMKWEGFLHPVLPRSRGRMRVRLGRNTADSEGSGTKYLTPWREYYCVSIEYDTVRVVNDDGGPILIHIRHVEIVARDIPSCWELELMDEDGCVILSPPEFVPGFFEHFFGSGDETATANARRVFAEVMSKIAESANDADRSSIEDLLRRVRR